MQLYRIFPTRLPIIFGLAFILTHLLSWAGEPTRPNIIFILADDLGYGDLSVYGQTHFQTPHLDRLAEEGFLSTRHYAGAPVCAPSRATLMTGRHTGQTRVRGNFGIVDGIPRQRVPLPHEETTVAEMLRSAGYATALIGKWGLGEEGSGSEPWNRGFDFFYGYINQAHAHNHYTEFLYRNQEKEALTGNFDLRNPQYTQDLFTHEAKTWIEQQGDQPFFLYLAYTTPHSHLECPEDSIAAVRRQYDWANDPATPEAAVTYAAMVQRLDQAVRSLGAHLEALGIAENTLLLFTSDNGPHKEDGNDPAFFKSAGPLRGIKRNLSEGGIRVPFIAWWPGQIPAGTRSNIPYAFWDFPATAAELSGAPLPSSAVSGVSYLGDLLGRPKKHHRDRPLYFEFSAGPGAKQAVIRGDWKVMRHTYDGPVELYFLPSDPGEAIDLAIAEPKRLNPLLPLFDDLRAPSSEYPIYPNHP